MNTCDAAINEMAEALLEMGYNRAKYEDETDLTPNQIEQDDLEYATGRMLERLIELDDTSFLFEFIVEGGQREDDKAFFKLLVEALTHDSDKAMAELHLILMKRVTDYGRAFLDEAIERMAV